MKRNWQNCNVTVLGLSLSGISAAKYLVNKGAKCLISEKQEISSQDSQKISELENLGIKVETGFHYEESIARADIIVTSPGIPPHAEVYDIVKKYKKEVINDLDLAFMETKKPFIAITGTNGKTTTTKLISDILINAGYKAPSCGNIGVPPISLIDDKVDYFVLEISSYQIYTSKYLKPEIGVFLNYFPDHLEWHGGEKNYFEAKASMFIDSRSPGWAFLNAGDKNILKLRKKIPSQVCLFGKETKHNGIFIKEKSIVHKKDNKIIEIIKLQDIPLLGKHNYENIMAAIGVTSFLGVNNDKIKSGILNFKSPEHRLEYVEKIKGIDYYNDSKSTNCESTICALKAFDNKKVVLIAGGRDKNTDLKNLAKAIEEKASNVILFGEASKRFYDYFKNLPVKIKTASSLKEAVDLAAKTNSGPVLFSPACASFDMFKNFEERGRTFKEYVRQKASSGKT